MTLRIDNEGLVENSWTNTGGNTREFVEERVVENIHLVSEIKSATNAGPAFTRWIPGKTYLRTKRVPRKLRNLTSSCSEAFELGYRGGSLCEHVAFAVVAHTEVESEVLRN